MYSFFVKAAFISKYLHDPVCKYKFRYLQKKQTPDWTVPRVARNLERPDRFSSIQSENICSWSMYCDVPHDSASLATAVMIRSMFWAVVQRVVEVFYFSCLLISFIQLLSSVMPFCCQTAPFIFRITEVNFTAGTVLLIPSLCFFLFKLTEKKSETMSVLWWSFMCVCFLM